MFLLDSIENQIDHCLIILYKYIYAHVSASLSPSPCVFLCISVLSAVRSFVRSHALSNICVAHNFVRKKTRDLILMACHSQIEITNLQTTKLSKSNWTECQLASSFSLSLSVSQYKQCYTLIDAIILFDYHSIFVIFAIKWPTMLHLIL